MKTDPEIVFLFGLPRSGTKLTRELLNRHPDIAIFPHESHFIPYFARRARSIDFANRAAFNRFYREFTQTTFARRMRACDVDFDESEWFGLLRDNSYRNVLEALFRLYSRMTGRSVVGDKTPGYVCQVPLLSELFPSARFVHVFRDPRDYAGSINRAWGKSIPRAAQRWKDQIRKYRADADLQRIERFDFAYERLLREPEATLTELCGFLGVAFEPGMLSLDRPAENLGSARGALTVVSENAGKWKASLARADLEQVEAIAGDLMAELGYAPELTRGDRDLGPLRMLGYRLADGANLLRFRMRDEGSVLGALSESRRALRFRDVDD